MKISKIIKSYDWIGISKSFLYALILASIFRSFFFEFYKIPTGSMIPTLREGDHLFISKYNYGYSKYSFFPFNLPILDKRIFFKEPSRGDIIVFKLPTDTSTNYIKRLIGLPGDVIQMVEGVLHINGEPVARSRVGSFTGMGPNGAPRTYDIYEETLPNGVKYETLDANLHMHLDFPDDTQEYKVPEAHYFFMGDNRNNSIDSRFLDKVGYVPKENLVGRAAYLLITSDFSIFKFIQNGDTGRAFARFTYAD